MKEYKVLVSMEVLYSLVQVICVVYQIIDLLVIEHIVYVMS